VEFMWAAHSLPIVSYACTNTVGHVITVVCERESKIATIIQVDFSPRFLRSGNVLGIR
jgi:hypothetical protein